MVNGQGKPKVSEGAIGTIEILKRFLQSRWNASIAMLDLSAIKLDENIIKLGVTGNVFSVKGNKMFLALMKVAGDMGIKPISVNLAGNELVDVNGVTTLAQEFPHLQNLSLADNKLSKWKDIFTII